MGKLTRAADSSYYLAVRQDIIAEELEALRLEDKTHTVKIKQLFADKLVNINILILFRTYGLQ
jgi:hypothetical protein